MVNTAVLLPGVALIFPLMSIPLVTVKREPKRMMKGVYSNRIWWESSLLIPLCIRYKEVGMLSMMAMISLLVFLCQKALAVRGKIAILISINMNGISAQIAICCIVLYLFL